MELTVLMGLIFLQIIPNRHTYTHTHTHYKTVKIKHVCIKFFFSNKRRHWVKDAKGRQYNINRYTNIQQWDCHMSSKYSFVFSTNGIYRKSAFFFSLVVCVFGCLSTNKNNEKKKTTTTTENKSFSRRSLKHT